LDVLFPCKLNEITITKLVGVFHTYDAPEWQGRKFTGNSEGLMANSKPKSKMGFWGFAPSRVQGQIEHLVNGRSPLKLKAF